MKTTTRRRPPRFVEPCRFARKLMDTKDRKTRARLLWAWRRGM